MFNKFLFVPIFLGQFLTAEAQPLSAMLENLEHQIMETEIPVSARRVGYGVTPGIETYSLCRSWFMQTERALEASGQVKIATDSQIVEDRNGLFPNDYYVSCKLSFVSKARFEQQLGSQLLRSLGQKLNHTWLLQHLALNGYPYFEHFKLHVSMDGTINHSVEEVRVNKDGRGRVSSVLFEVAALSGWIAHQFKLQYAVAGDLTGEATLEHLPSSHYASRDEDELDERVLPYLFGEIRHE